MKYDDLEKTIELFDMTDEVPVPIENLEMEGVNKEHLTGEVSLVPEETIPPKEEKTQEEKPVKEKKKKKDKKSFSEKWKSLSKGKKIAIIVIPCVILVLILCFVVYSLLEKGGKEENKPKEPEAPKVIVEKENYIYRDGILTFINEDGDELGTYECQNKDEKLCFVVNYSDEDTFDGLRNVYEDEELIERKSAIYLGKYAFVYDNEKAKGGSIQLYDMQNKKSEGVYDLVKGFANSNYVILKNTSDKYGAIEFSEDGIKDKIGFSFDYLGQLAKDTKIMAKTGNKYFIYNKDGKAASKGINYEIRSYNDKYIVVDNNGAYVYDYNSSLVFDEAYDYARLLDDYVVLIKDKKLFIKDYKNNKYNEEGISLDNTNYNELNIYDSKKTLKETKKAFSISIDDNGINVGYKNRNTEKTKTIVIGEGKLSAKLQYLNYFDGVLYIYNDEDKLNLLGKYNCQYKNASGGDESTLSNCGIATESFFSVNETETDFTESLGLIPIFNDRYVFIKDTLDGSNSSINLYDLKNNRTLGKYSGVDASSYVGVDDESKNKVTFVNTDDTYVIARNKNNKFGVIKVENEVKSVVAFNYQEIEKIHDNFMLHENSDTYVLVDKTGKVVTTKYGYRIVDYKNEYVKTKDEDYYYIYDFEGNKVDESKFYDIKLEDDYYVVIDINKKLDIHKYDNSSYSLATPIDVDGENYKIDYEVKKVKDGFTVKIKSSGKSYSVDNYGYVNEDRIPSAIAP